MVASKKRMTIKDDILLRTAIMTEIEHLIDTVAVSADQIAEQRYAQGYRSLAHAHAVLAMIANKVHALDLNSGGGS